VKIETANAITEAAGDLGIEARVYADYGGRGMRGKTTAGVVAPSVASLYRAIAVAAVRVKAGDRRLTFTEFVDDLDISQDSMGLDTIVY
jgi:hypothetical protein